MFNCKNDNSWQKQYEGFFRNYSGEACILMKNLIECIKQVSVDFTPPVSLSLLFLKSNYTDCEECFSPLKQLKWSNKFQL